MPGSARVGAPAACRAGERAPGRAQVRCAPRACGSGTRPPSDRSTASCVNCARSADLGPRRARSRRRSVRSRRPRPGCGPRGPSPRRRSGSRPSRRPRSNSSARKARGASTSSSPDVQALLQDPARGQEARRRRSAPGSMTAPDLGLGVEGRDDVGQRRVGSSTMSESMNSTTSPVPASAPWLRCAQRSGPWSATTSASRTAIRAVSSVEALSTTMISTSGWVWWRRDSRHASSVRSELLGRDDGADLHEGLLRGVGGGGGFQGEGEDAGGDAGHAERVAEGGEHRGRAGLAGRVQGAGEEHAGRRGPGQAASDR